MIGFLTLTTANRVSSINPFAPKMNDFEKTQNAIKMLEETMPPSSFKALTSQIEAMNDLDQAKPCGKNLDLAA